MQFSFDTNAYREFVSLLVYHPLFGYWREPKRLDDRRRRIRSVIFLISSRSNLLVTCFQEDATSLARRVKKTDAREIESYYKQYYEKYVLALNKGDQADR